jgi:hypothetical protein
VEGSHDNALQRLTFTIMSLIRTMIKVKTHMSFQVLFDSINALAQFRGTEPYVLDFGTDDFPEPFQVEKSKLKHSTSTTRPPPCSRCLNDLFSGSMPDIVNFFGKEVNICSNEQCKNLSGDREFELKTFTCSSCKSSAYCSTECQIQHWPMHQKMCLSSDEF